MKGYGTPRDRNETDDSAARPTHCLNGDNKTRGARDIGRRLRRHDARKARAEGRKETANQREE